MRCCASTYCVHILNTHKICSNLLNSLNIFTKEISSSNVLLDFLITYLDDSVIIQLGYQSFDINTNNFKQKKIINWCIIGKQLVVTNWIFDNLHLGIINSYYPKFCDNVLVTQCFDIDIDNLCDPKKIQKKPTKWLFKRVQV